MEQSLSLESNRHSASKENMVRIRVHKTRPIVFIPSQKNPVEIGPT